MRACLMRGRPARVESSTGHRGPTAPIGGASELSSCCPARLALNGPEAWSAVIARDYEGVVAKDEASLSRRGRLGGGLKVKQSGWTVAEDGWQRRINAARII